MRFKPGDLISWVYDGHRQYRLVVGYRLFGVEYVEYVVVRAKHPVAMSLGSLGWSEERRIGEFDLQRLDAYRIG